MRRAWRGAASWGAVAAGAAAISLFAATSSASHGVASSATLQNRTQIAVQDSGETFSFPLATAFTVRLPREGHDPEALRCEPAGIVKETPYTIRTKLQLFAVRFETVAAGTCTFTDGDFSVHIQVEGSETPGVIPSGVKGMVVNNSLCAAHVDSHVPCASEPLVGYVEIRKASTTDEVYKTVASEADGSFSINLPAGEYLVHPAGTSAAPGCNWARVIVDEHAYAHTVLQCGPDTGYPNDILRQ